MEIPGRSGRRKIKKMTYVYIAVMALVTYLIRMLPLTFITKKIKSKFFASFLYYVPYACLTAMTIPSIFYATGNFLSAIVGFTVAIAVALKTKNLMLVALCACLAVFVVELF